MNEQNWGKYIKEIENKIKKLKKEKNYIEIIFWFSNILEVELKDLIIKHQKAVEFICKREKLKFKRFTKKELEKLTLGQLKDRAEIFVKKDIIKEITKFNELRKKVVHGLFSCQINSLREEAIKFLPRFWRLTENLVDIEIAITKILGKYKTRRIIEKFKK